MNRAIAIIALIMLSTTARVQEHAPVAAQCQADKAVWLEQLSRAETTKLLVPELSSRMWEMASCQAVDPPNSADYVKISANYLMAMDVRYQDFVKRNNLVQQFLQEDAEGKR